MSAVPVLSRLAGVGVLAAAVVTVPAAAAAPTVDGLGGAYAAICDEEEVHGGARPAPGQPDKERNTLTTAEARALDRTLDRKMERPVNQRQSARVQQQAVVVDVVIHEVQGSDGTGAVSDATWDAQIDELNENFAGGESAEAAETGFRFNLLDVRGTPTIGGSTGSTSTASSAT